MVRLNRIKWGFVVAYVVIIVIFTIKGVPTSPAGEIEVVNLSWEMHNFAFSYKRPIIVIIPDNSLNYNAGIEELLLKGFSDFPTQTITKGNKLMHELAPRLSYRSDFIKQKPKLPYGTKVVIVWFDKVDSSYDKATSLIEFYPELKKVLATDGTECHQWFLEDYSRKANICAVS